MRKEDHTKSETSREGDRKSVKDSELRACSIESVIQEYASQNSNVVMVSYVTKIIRLLNAHKRMFGQQN